LKALIFCGGFGTRMNNGEPGKLKPLIQVAGKEILRHIVSIYEFYGICDFTLLGGYRIEDLINFASKYSTKSLHIHVLDTGEGTSTGGRLMLAKDEINLEPFLLTYGDSLTNFNLNKCIAFKEKHKSDMIISTFNKFIEYGILDIDVDDRLTGIHEKTFSVPINAGFYVLDKRVFKYINSIEDSFEIDVLPRLIADRDIVIRTFKVDFWHPMDTPTDQKKLNAILESTPDILYS
jgi:glucose-1-phosphate cytidylyltransferase